MITLMPASRHFWSAPATSGRGGSSRPTSPARVISASAFASSKLSGNSRQAKARTRSPFSAMASAARAEPGGEVVGELGGAAVHRRPGASREDDLRRTLAIEHLALRRRMHRREPLALRVERDLVHARAVRQRGHRIGGELDERDLHRIAEPAGSGGGARVFQIVAARRHFKKAAMRLDQRGELIGDRLKHPARNEEPL